MSGDTSSEYGVLELQCVGLRSKAAESCSLGWQMVGLSKCGNIYVYMYDPLDLSGVYIPATVIARMIGYVLSCTYWLCTRICMHVWTFTILQPNTVYRLAIYRTWLVKTGSRQRCMLYNDSDSILVALAWSHFSYGFCNVVDHPRIP